MSKLIFFSKEYVVMLLSFQCHFAGNKCSIVNSVVMYDVPLNTEIIFKHNVVNP